MISWRSALGLNKMKGTFIFTVNPFEIPSIYRQDNFLYNYKFEALAFLLLQELNH